MSSTLEEAKERLNSAVESQDSLTNKEVLRLSMEVDRYIIIEQRLRLERLINEYVLGSNTL